MNQGSSMTMDPEVFFAYVLIAVGGFLLLNRLEVFWVRDLLKYWPVGLIGAGIVQLLERGESR